MKFYFIHDDFGYCIPVVIFSLPFPICSQARATLSAQERSSSESSDALRAAQAEAEKAASKARSIEVRASEREADLKDRIRVLEERLVLLTEPDSALFSEQMEEAKLSTSSTIPSDETPEAVAKRCATLLVEVFFHILFIQDIKSLRRETAHLG